MYRWGTISPIHRSRGDKTVNNCGVYQASHKCSSVLLGCAWEHLCIHGFIPPGLYSAHLLFIQPHQHRCWYSSLLPLPDCPAKLWKQLSGHSVFLVFKHYLQCCFAPRVQICLYHLFLVFRSMVAAHLNMSSFDLRPRPHLFDMPTQCRG